MNAKWLKVNLHKEENKEKVSKIIQTEWEITEAIRRGHRSHWGDEFKEKRREMLQLRKEILDGNK